MQGGQNLRNFLTNKHHFGSQKKEFRLKIRIQYISPVNSMENSLENLTRMEHHFVQRYWCQERHLDMGFVTHWLLKKHWHQQSRVKHKVPLQKEFPLKCSNLQQNRLLFLHSVLFLECGLLHFIQLLHLIS